MSYRESPLALDSKFLPPGAVRRILYRDDSHRYGRNRRKNLGLEYEPFPTYATYREYEVEVLRLYKWYEVPVLEIGRAKKPAPPREDNVGRGLVGRYSVKSCSVLNSKSLDVLRRMLLVENSTYYMKHASVANDVWYGERIAFAPQEEESTCASSGDISNTLPISYLTADLGHIFISPISKR